MGQPSTKGLAVVLGVLLVGVIGAGIWLTNSDDGGIVDPGEEKAERRIDEGAGRSEFVSTDAAIVGRVVVAKTNEPVADHDVTLGDDRTVRTNADGRFRFDGLAEGGPYSLAVVAEGYAEVRFPGIALERGETFDLGEIRLDAAGRISVRVVDAKGDPLPAATVSAYAAPDIRNVDWTQRWRQLAIEPVPVTAIKTGDDGRSYFDRLNAGMWTFTAAKKGYGRTGRTNVRIVAGLEIDEVEIRLSPGFRLIGRVLDPSDNPIAHARVIAQPSGASSWQISTHPLVARAVADENGRYELTDLPGGDTAILVAAGTGSPIPIVTARVPPIDAMDLVVPMGGTLTGEVVDEETGDPIAGAAVRISGMVGQSWVSSEAVADANGRFRFESVPGAMISQLIGIREGWVSAMQPWMALTVPFGETAERTVTMRRGVRIRGTVTGPDGPIAGARIQPYSRMMTGVPTAAVTTDAAGEYSFHTTPSIRFIVVTTANGHYIDGLPSQGWQIVQSNDPKHEKWWVQAPDIGELVHDIQMLAGATANGRVVDEQGNPVAGVRVSAQGNGEGTMTAADGTFTLDGVRPPTRGNRAGVWTRKDGWVTRVGGAVTFASGAPTGEEIIVTMSPAPTVTGTVSSSTGEALRGGWVRARMVRANPSGLPRGMPQMQPQTPASAKVPVDAEGRYELSLPFATGSFVVEASADGYTQGKSTPVAFVSGTTEYTADVLLTAGARLEGRVTEAGTGKGLAGARISSSRQAPQQQPGWYGQRGPTASVVALTDADGRFVLDGLSDGKIYVKAELAGFVAGSAPVTMPTSGEATIEMQRALGLRGTVKFTDGSPAAGVFIYVNKEGGQNMPVAQGSAGPDGAFRFDNLAPGAYKITIQALWTNSSGSNVQMIQAGPFQAGDDDVAIEVEAAGVITGTIHDTTGRAVAGCTITATLVNAAAHGAGPNTGGAMGWAQAKWDGTFEIKGLKPGATYDLTTQGVQSGSNTGPSHQPATQKGIPTGTANVKFVLEQPLSIAGTIVDETGSPVAKGTLTLHQIIEGKDGKTTYRQVNRRVSTDEFGAFDARGLAEGSYRISVRVKNVFRPLRGGENVPAGTTGLRLTSFEGLALEGVVVGPGNEPVSKAPIHAYADGNMYVGQAVTDANGRFRLTGFTADAKIRLLVQPSNWAHKTIQNVTAGGDLIRIELEPGLLTSGVLFDAKGNPMPSATILFTRSEAKQQRWGRTDAQGRFTSSSLTDGTWEVMYRSGRAFKNVGQIEAGRQGQELRMTE